MLSNVFINLMLPPILFYFYYVYVYGFVLVSVVPTEGKGMHQAFWSWNQGWLSAS